MTDGAPSSTGAGPDELTTAVPDPDRAARVVFGERLALAQRFATLLAGAGVAHGHLGPREVPRLWERHLVNSALVTELLPAGASVVDVGSGAGLPGLAMAVRRPDLHLTLVEPMLRRTRFLATAIDELDLGPSVRVVRGRAEDPDVRAEVAGSQWVVARAVAPLARLVEWSLPLLAPAGRLLALKGASADDEVHAAHDALRRLRAEAQIVEVVDRSGTHRIWVVSVQRVGHRSHRKGSHDAVAR